MKKLVSIVLPIMLFMVGVTGVNAATIKISKVDVDTKKPVVGATMTLSKPKIGSAGGDVVKTFVTDGSVQEITVEPGDYVLWENEPAPGYLTAKDVEINVKSADQVVEIVSETDYTKAQFRAINAKTGKDIAGVKFELYNSKNVKVLSWTSDGTVFYKNYLPQDVYTLKIVAVPKGYELVGNQTVIIDENCFEAKVVPVNIPEKPVTPTPTPNPGKPTPTPDEITDVPNTMMNNSSIFGIVGFIVIALGGGLIYKNAKNN